MTHYNQIINKKGNLMKNQENLGTNTQALVLASDGFTPYTGVTPMQVSLTQLDNANSRNDLDK